MLLLSRVADALYWIGRYLERAEHTARLIDVRLDLDLDRVASGRWDFERLYISLRLPRTAPLPATPTGLIEAVVFDPANRDSVLACVTSAREGARQVREQISSSMWERLNGLLLNLRQVRSDGDWNARHHHVLRSVIEGIHLFQGTTDATMNHGEGWRYLQVGRFLERAATTAALLKPHFMHKSMPVAGMAGTPGSVQWGGLLKSCSAFEAYCRQYTAQLRPQRVAEFLLLNAESPRSVRFSAARVESSLRSVAILAGREAGGRAERMAGRLHASLAYGQVDEILSDNPHAYFDSIARQCALIHSALYQTYIAYPVDSALPA